MSTSVFSGTNNRGDNMKSSYNMVEWILAPEGALYVWDMWRVEEWDRFNKW